MSESNLVYNERLKVLAGMFHNLAVASITSITGGVVLPLINANAGMDMDLTFIVTIPVGIMLALFFASSGQNMFKDLLG